MNKNIGEKNSCSNDSKILLTKSCSKVCERSAIVLIFDVIYLMQRLTL